MEALVVRDKQSRIIERVDVSGMSVKQIDKAEEKMISELNDFGDFEERFTIELEG